MSIPELINRAYFPPSPQHSWEEKRPIQLPSIRQVSFARSRCSEVHVINILQAFPELHTAKPHGSTFQSEPHSASSDAPPSLDWSENPKELFPYRRAAYASHPEPYYTDAIPPRVYKSPAMRIRSDCSSSPPSTLHAKLASAKAAAARDRSVPFASAPTHTGLQSPPLLDSLPVSRPDYPSNQTRLPPLTLDPNVGQHQGWSGYSSDPSGRRATEGHQGVSPYDSPISPYSAYHPRMHSYPGSTTHAPNQHPHHDGYVGGYDVPVGAATKQRKRRGNLPKKTTDLLRAWFKMHLQHPYPTEDEKQELMRQTDLQMSMFSYSNFTRYMCVICLLITAQQIRYLTGSSMLVGASFQL